jgi:2-C-methyl-D-erythritol 4-phosphate cytidylyltransferase / 2-C-methyl-D-erythritol 2,4-cyclodiphosphate synthase
MMHVTAIVAAGGSGRRVGADVPKQFLDLGGQTVLERSVEAFATHPAVHDVIVVLPEMLVTSAPQWIEPRASVRVVAGGARRQDSVANAFKSLAETTEIVLVHDAARPFVTADMISQSIDAAARYGAAIVARPASDTVKRVTVEGQASPRVIETLPRESIYLAQTPQAFRRRVLADAVALGESGVHATDEASLAERAGHTVHIVEGSAENMKITTAGDLETAQRRWQTRAPQAKARVGTGYDLHRLVDGRRLMIGGIHVPSDKGAHGHSDGDVVCHAATDALLGAASLGDIGRHFPDTDPAWKDAASLQFLGHATALAAAAGFRVANLDVVVILERPKIAPFVDRIRESLAAALEIDVERVSVKGKTNEGVDAIGRGEAIAAHAVALLTID